MEKHCYEIWAQRDSTCIECPVIKTFKSKKVHAGEIATPDGRMWYIQGNPVFDDNKKLIGAVETTLEITDRKMAEEELQRSEERYRSIVEHSLIGIAFSDANFRMLYVNDKYCDIIGYPKDEILKHNILMPLTEEGKKIVRDHYNKRLKGESVPVKYEIEIIRKKGEKRRVSISSHAFTNSKGQKRVVAQFLDITERKLMEKALREREKRYRFLSSITEQVRDSVLVTDLDYKIIYINKAAEILFGYSKNEIYGKSPDLLNAEPLANDIQAQIYSTVSSGKEWMGVNMNRKKDGSTFYCEFTVSPLTDENGLPLGYIGIQRDVTDRKKMEMKIQQSIEELKRSNEDLEQFTSMASHDLGEPLRVISGYMHLLEEIYGKKLDNEGLNYIKSVQNSANRMQQLINDLLSLSHVGIEGIPFKMADMTEILRESLANLQASIDESGAVISIDKELPKTNVDRFQIVQVFQNLIGNSIKFRRGEKPKIHIGTAKKKDRWIFSIKDDGIGIEKKHFDDIFVVFQRLHSKSEYPGTGIGLTICKKIIERHGGQIWVDSIVDKGSTFYFSIPI